MSADSRYLLDDRESGGSPSDAYMAYSGGLVDDEELLANKKKKRRRIFVIVAVICLVIVIAAGVGFYLYKKGEDGPSGPTPPPAIADSYRLPTTMIPNYYTVRIQVDLDQLTFNGSVAINAVVTAPMPAFVVHSLGLTINSVSLSADGVGVSPNSFSYQLYGQSDAVSNPGTQYLLVVGENGYQVPVTNNFVIFIIYNGTLPLAPTRSNGLYATNYTIPNTNITTRVAATQFEPTHARRAFPCFDELQLKAVFKVYMYVKNGLTALSNGKYLNSTDLGTGFQMVEFNTTVVQPSYLMAFAVLDGFVNVAPTVTITPSLNYPFLVWGQQDRAGDVMQHIQQSSNRGAQVQQWFAQALNAPFPLQKQDQVAVPRKGGAMENYGLVLYGVDLLIWDNETTSVAYQSGINVNAHELAHMLWGDWMTPTWWSDTWLKEGSATFWSYVGMQAIMGDVADYHSDAQAVATYQESAFKNDALPNTVPLILPSVLTSTDIANHFGGPTYNKGGSFLRMIRRWMKINPSDDDTNFFTGSSAFLNAYKFSNAWSTDYFRYLNQSNVAWPSVDLYAAMYVWGTRAGFPLVTVSETILPSGQRQWTLTQSPYNNIDNTQRPLLIDAFMWSSSTGVPTVSSQWAFTSPSATSATLLIDPSISLAKLNYNRTGFYRVLYPLTTWANFSAGLLSNSTLLPEQDRISIVYDLFALQYDGYLQSWATVLNQTLWLKNERDYSVWRAAITAIAELWNKVRFAVTDLDLPLFQLWIQYLVSDTFNSLQLTQITPQQHLIGMLQVILPPLACRWNVFNCIVFARNAFLPWSANRTAVYPTFPANLRNTIFIYGANNTDIGALVNCYRTEFTLPRASRCLSALMYAATPQYVQMVLSQPQYIRSDLGDTRLSILDAYLNLQGKVAWDNIINWLMTNTYEWQQLINTYDVASNNNRRNDLTALFNILVASVQTSYDLDRIQKFISDQQVNAPLSDVAQSVYAAAINTANTNIAWVNNNLPRITAALNQIFTP